MAKPARQRILVVNGDRRLAASVQGLLSEEGYDVTVAFDGNAGLEVLARWQADLVVLDMVMPGLNGWGFLEELSRRADRSRPLVLVWSVEDENALARARLLGATECLRRETTNPDTLLAAITRILQDARDCPGLDRLNVGIKSSRKAPTPARTAPYSGCSVQLRSRSSDLAAATWKATTRNRTNILCPSSGTLLRCQPLKPRGSCQPQS